MTASDTRREVIEHLETALAAEEDSKKNFHIRQALQLLGIDRG